MSFMSTTTVGISRRAFLYSWNFIIGNEISNNKKLVLQTKILLEDMVALVIYICMKMYA